MKQTSKTLVQCDFDGTVTEEDVSFLLLDAFAGGNWRQLFSQYQEGEIKVGDFNRRAFAMVSADKRTLIKYMEGRIRIRQGFRDMVDYCRKKGFRFVIVSNGLDFYIEKILGDIGQGGIEVFAAQTRFHPECLKVQYIGPDGNPLDSDFKETYVNLFLAEGYRVIYIGNGASDVSPARRSHHVFATGDLLVRFRKAGLNCIPFTDFNQIIKDIEGL